MGTVSPRPASLARSAERKPKQVRPATLRGASRFLRIGYRRTPSGEVLLEERDRPIPGEFRRRLVIARRRIVVKAMLRAGIHVHLVWHARGLQRLLVFRPHRVDALIVLGVLDQERRLDLRNARRLDRKSTRL